MRFKPFISFLGFLCIGLSTSTYSQHPFDEFRVSLLDNIDKLINVVMSDFVSDIQYIPLDHDFIHSLDEGDNPVIVLYHLK